jgi:galactokinase
LSDSHIASEALAEDVVSALMRVLEEGSSKGKRGASHVLLQLLKNFPLSDVLTRSAQFQFAVLAIVKSLNGMDMDGTDAAEALEVRSSFFIGWNKGKSELKILPMVCPC